MKKNKLLFAFITFFVSVIPAFAQVSGAYRFTKGESECLLCLYKDGAYEIIIGSPPVDYQTLAYLSYGEYRITGSKIFCRDQFNGFELIFKRDNSKIVPVLAYADLMNHCFAYWPEYSKDIESARHYQSDPRKGLFKTITDQRRYFSSKKNVSFVSGVYQDRFLTYELSINGDGSYIFKILNLVVSKGKWVKSNNELRFFDKVLRVEFYSFIQNDVILFGFTSTGNDVLRLNKTFFKN